MDIAIVLGTIFVLGVGMRWYFGRKQSKHDGEVTKILKQIDRDISSIDRKLLERGVRRASDSSRDSER